MSIKNGLIVSIFLGLPIALLQADIWQDIEKKAHNAVVQVHAQIAQFNWLQPFSTPKQYESRGTAFFLDAEGTLLTTFHVVDQAKTIWITIPALGKQKLTVTTKGIAPEVDLALLKVDETSLEIIKKKLTQIPFLALGDSDTIERTQEILVLGYPLGLEYVKSTRGIISGREFLWGNPVLQLTAPISEGSSGAPVLNDKAQVIGISSSTLSKAENLGYAIPINDFKIILSELNKNRLVRKPYLGVQYTVTNEALSTYLKNPFGGIYLNLVIDDSLAKRAGIAVGDVLYKFNEYELDNYGYAQVPWNTDKVSLSEIIRRVKMHDQVHLVLYRNGKKRTESINIDSIPIYPIRTIYPDYEKVEYEIIGGMVIMQLVENNMLDLIVHNDSLYKYTEPENKTKPVLVISHILPGSLARKFENIGTGDEIIELNGITVNTIDEFRNALTKSAQTDFLVIKTARNVLAAFSMADIAQQEELLATLFKYTISPTVKKLLEKYR